MSAMRSSPVVPFRVAVGVVSLILLSILVAPCPAQNVLITDTRDATQNLDVLYSGSGDRSALLTASAVVDVPIGNGEGLYTANIAPWTITNIGAVRGDIGVYMGLGGTVTNLGEITSRALNGAGIYMANGGGTNAVINASSGTIIAGSSSSMGGIGVNLLSSLPTSTVDNYGDIYAYGDGVSSRGTGVLLNGGGTVNNQADAAIIGGYGDTTGIGVYLYGPGTVNNSGTITGNNYQGITIVGTGTVNNTGSGTITGNGATIGVYITGGTGTVTNEENATITGGRNGVVISGSGSVTNDGTIVGEDASYYGVRFSNSAVGTYTTAVTNGGTISGGAAGVSVRFVPSSGPVRAHRTRRTSSTTPEPSPRRELWEPACPFRGPAASPIRSPTTARSAACAVFCSIRTPAASPIRSPMAARSRARPRPAWRSSAPPRSSIVARSPESPASPSTTPAPTA